MVTIRPADETDAEQIIAHWHKMKPRMNISEDEIFYSLEEEQAIIRAGQGWGIMLVAVSDTGEIVGVCTAKKSDRKAYSHNARVGCSIRPEFHSQGIGTRFLKMLQDMAEDHGILRLEIISYANNQAARKLFYECGWTPEGVMKKYALQNGEFVDVFLLAWYV